MFIRDQSLADSGTRSYLDDSISILFFSSTLSFSAPCVLLKCDFYAECKAQLDGSLECVCPRQCPLSFEPVCGSDAQTYPNQCTLQVESCRTQTRITVAKRGQCGAYSFYIRERTLPHPGMSSFSSGNEFLFIWDQSLAHPGTSFCSSRNELLFIRERTLAHPGTSSCPYRVLHNLFILFLLTLATIIGFCTNEGYVILERLVKV